MNRAIVDCPFGSVGFDCDVRLSLEQYRELRTFGLRFAIRYLGDLTTEEVDDANAADVGIVPIQHAHAPGWLVGSPGHTGAEDGRRAINDANAAALPPVPIWCDFEEPSVSTTIAEAHQYAAEWCAVVSGGKHPDPGVYWGSGNPGSSEDVYRLAFVRYFKSFSDVVTPHRRGYQLIQLYHFPQGELLVREAFPQASPLVANVAIDLDVACSDYLGSRPKMVAAG